MVEAKPGGLCSLHVDTKWHLPQPPRSEPHRPDLAWLLLVPVSWAGICMPGRTCQFWLFVFKDGEALFKCEVPSQPPGTDTPGSSPIQITERK